MSSRSNLTALLAVLAVAGYQNRDKIAEVLGGLRGPQHANPGLNPAVEQDGVGGILGNLANGGLGSLLGGSSPDGVLSGGLGSLIDLFRQNGAGDRADSWVRTGPNDGIESHDLSTALGDDLLAELAAKTGLSHEQILERLSNTLPSAVDDLTPEGVLPTSQDFEGAVEPGRTSVPNVSRPV